MTGLSPQHAEAVQVCTPRGQHTLATVVGARVRAPVLPSSHHRPRAATQVVHYQPGQQYMPHYDWFNAEKDPRFEEKTAGRGNRLVSVFAYLSECDAGAKRGCGCGTELGLKLGLGAVKTCV